MSKKHTPAPLIVAKQLGDTYYIEDSIGNLIALTGNVHSAPNRETAEFIVKSYNNHDKLVEMVELMCMDLEERGKGYGDAYIMAKELIAEINQQ